MTERYFAFGANVNPATLARRSVAPRSARPARLERHRLVFDQPGLPLLEPAFASVSPDPGSLVWGVVYELDVEAMARLRAFEGDEYREVTVSVGVDDRRLDAQTFVTRGDHAERAPSRRYLRLIRDGGAAHGLPREWLDELATRPSLYVPVVHDAWSVLLPAIDHLHRFFARPAERSG